MIDEALITRMVGILGGSLCALVFVPPKTRSGFVRRLLSAFIFGWIMGPIVLDYMNWPPTDEKIAASDATAAFMSWWLMGIGKKIADKLGEKEV